MGKRRVYRPRPNNKRIEVIRTCLISWFQENGRDLPWRRTRDPYGILVSEVMLQQIQVKRAIPFYEGFIERFPTVEALAGASVADAIRAWGDLGRYRRVVNLHRTARIVVAEHGGEIPDDQEVLVKLPGIGPYTAGAVACFAYERDVAFADTNMQRVLQRYFFGVGAVDPATHKHIIEIAAKLVPPGQGWLWNQALMETGALICTARRPSCDDCPLRDGCRARKQARSTGWPQPRRKGIAYKYEGSNRYYRGRVLAELREDSHAGEGGIVLRDLGGRIRPDFDERDAGWLHTAVESLCKDGLAKTSSVREVPGMVAEERALYDGPKEPLEEKVSLP